MSKFIIVLFFVFSLFAIAQSADAAPAYVQSCSQYGSNTSSPACAFSSSVSNGNVVMFYINWYSTTITLNSITSSCINNFNFVQNNIIQGSFTTSMGYGTVINGGLCTLTAHFSGSPPQIAFFGREVNGIGALDTYGSGYEWTSAPSISITTATDGDYIFGAAADDDFNNRTLTPGPGFIQRENLKFGGFDTLGEEYVQSVHGNINVNFVSTGIATYVSGAMAFKPSDSAPTIDTIAPTVPTGLSATAVSQSQINLNWTASTDAVGVTGYTIYRGGVQIGTTTGTSYSNTGLTANTAYSYTVDAFDATGNHSSQSMSASVTTQSLPPSDTTPPSVPTNLSASAVSSSQVNLSWIVSTDNTAVTGYKIYRNGSQIGTSVTNSYSDTGLSSGTTYIYTVSAYDGANNNSAQSASASSTTQVITASGTVIDNARKIDWGLAGAGTLPTNRTQCGTTIMPYNGTADLINNAIANCGQNQFVQLGAGTFNLTNGISFGAKNNVTLRGSGPDKTFLIFTGSNTCAGKFAAICVMSAYPTDSDDGGNFADWVSGFSRGTNSITISATITGNGVKPEVGTIIQLDQLSDDAVDTGNIYICSTPATCTQSGSSGQKRSQQQLVTVTSVSGTGPYTLGISPGLYMPNWRSAKSPRAWWTGGQPSNTLPITGAGIESLSIDSSHSGNIFGITFFLATNSWVKNVRQIRSLTPIDIRASTKQVLLFISTHITIKDNYFFGQIGGDDYGVDCYWCSDNLVENNIFQHMPNSMMNEKGQGNVWAYNYSINTIWNQSSWAQGTGYYHAPGSSFDLHEGNDGHGLELENYFGQANFITAFRNRWTGYEPTQDAQTVPIFIYGLNRYENIVGNVLGVSGYHQQYQNVATGLTTSSNSDCNHSIYAIGLGGNCSSGDGVTWPLNDPILTSGTLLRWGNWDVVTGPASGPKFDVAEVPSGISLYSNPMPSSQILPNSLYLPAKPPWWGTVSWPAIGPDVNGGDIIGLGGHAYRIPSRKCFEDVMGGTYGDATARTFNADVCYYGATTPPPTYTPGDFNHDGAVNSLDYSLLNANWFKTTNITLYDLQTDGIINSFDYAIFKSNWGR